VFYNQINPAIRNLKNTFQVTDSSTRKPISSELPFSPSEESENYQFQIFETKILIILVSGMYNSLSLVPKLYNLL